MPCMYHTSQMLTYSTEQHRKKKIHSSWNFHSDQDTDYYWGGGVSSVYDLTNIKPDIDFTLSFYTTQCTFNSWTHIYFMPPECEM